MFPTLPSIHLFLLDLLTTLLGSCPAFSAPCHVSCVHICYFCDLEFIAPIFTLAKWHPPSDTSLTALLGQVHSDTPTTIHHFFSLLPFMGPFIFPASTFSHYNEPMFSFLLEQKPQVGYIRDDRERQVEMWVNQLLHSASVAPWHGPRGCRRSGVQCPFCGEHAANPWDGKAAYYSQSVL